MKTAVVTYTCCTKGCGMIFDVPAELDQKWRASGENFYCPAGHVMVYNGGLSAREKEEKERRVWAERDRAAMAARLDEAAERTARFRERARLSERTCPLCEWRTRRTNPSNAREAIADHLLAEHNATRQPVALLMAGSEDA